MPVNIGMGNSPPNVIGAALNAPTVPSLATYDISGLTLGTFIYVTDIAVAANFMLQASNDAIDHTTVEAVAGYSGLRWKKFVGGGGGVAVTPPSPATLAIWIDPFDLDGFNNATLVNGQNIASIKNKGTLGGNFVPVGGTPPTYSVNAYGVGAINFNGTDQRLQLTFAAIPQPYKLVVIGRRDSNGPNNSFTDGLASHRAALVDQAGTQLDMAGGTFLIAAEVVPQGKWSIISGEFNSVSSNLDMNNQFPLFGAYSVSGDAGAQTLTGLNVGGAFDGSSGLTGSIPSVMLWTAPYPSEQAIYDYWTQKLGPGIPTTLLTHFDYSFASTPKFQVAGGDLLGMMGDSITAGAPQPAWYLAGYQAFLNATGAAVTILNKGIGGQIYSQFAARFNADIIATNCNACIVEGGINDLLGGLVTSGVGPTTIQDFTAAMQAMINLWLGAGRAANKLAFMSLFCRGEQFPDPRKLQIDAYNKAMNALAAANGCPWFDARTPQQAYESVNNVPAPGNTQSPGPGGQTLLTADGVHLLPAGGATIMCNVAIAGTVKTG